MIELVNSISDLHRLEVKQLPELCEDIRSMLVATVMKNGGHLASNLGVVELAVALHYVFGEEDKIVWDVGHQSYVHKILTGRVGSFGTIRQKDGLSGFPDCSESEQDCFNVGHAGTSISAALGLAKARDLSGDNYNVVAVVGDGALTNGMTYEALNNIKNTKMLIVVNDNNMSIGDNVGAAIRNLSKLRVGKYDVRKQRFKNFLLKVPLLGKPTYKFLRWCKRKAKSRFVRNSYFDNFDIKYIGIVDGNEVKDLVYYLQKIRDNVTKPTVLHVVTKKGKGYAPAEGDPESYHSVSAHAGEMESSVTVGDTLTELARQDSSVCAVCAAMTKAVGFAKFEDIFPNRFFDVGIAEEHAVTFAAGLAKGGLHPYVAIYSTFLQRAYDQILHDVALQNLPVTFLVDRTGFVGADGQTHQGLFTFAYLSQVPNLQVWTPQTYRQLKDMIIASSHQTSPVAICYARTLNEDDLGFDGSWHYIRKVDSPKATILAVGARACTNALNAQIENCDVVDVATVKPLDDKLLSSICTPIILTVEEGVAEGSFGQKICQYFAGDKSKKVVCLNAGDRFVKHATIDDQIACCGLDAVAICDAIVKAAAN